MTDKELQPWQWPEAHWRGLLNQVRAGRRLAPAKWPNGARCAVALSFDSDHETNELRDGGKSIGRMAWGQYGNRVGVPRIVKLLKQYDVRASFYVPAVVAMTLSRRAARAGRRRARDRHPRLDPRTELGAALRERARPDDARGRRARRRSPACVRWALRTPSWDFSPDTLRIEKEMGLLYDSSLMADEECYELLLDGEPTGIVEVPVEWVRDDAVYFMMHRFMGLRPYTPPTDVFDIFRREFDAAYDEGGLCQLTFHPHIIGYRSRVWIVEELIRHAQAKGDVWFGTHAEVASWVSRESATG